MKDLIARHKPDIFVVSEARISGAVANKVVRGFGFSNWHMVEAHGFSGGLWVLWTDVNISVDIIASRRQWIHFKWSKEDKKSLYTTVYAFPTQSVHRQLWDDLGTISASLDDSWLLIGDFKVYLNADEKKGGVIASISKLCELGTVINELALYDLGFVLPTFTWLRLERCCSGTP